MKAQTEWVPVAQYLGSDDATGQQISLILQGQGIRSVEAGSLGYTVSVEAADVEKARDILRAAIEKEGLRATILPATDVPSRHR